MTDPIPNGLSAGGRGRCAPLGAGGVALAVVAALLLTAGADARPTKRQSLTKPIVVNALGDARDTNLKDGVCKVFALSKPGTSKTYCTLRAAIQTANAGKSGHYLIVLPAGTVHLAIKGSDDTAAKGDLDVVAADVRLLGKGPGKTTIDGGGHDRVFDVRPSAGLTLQSMKITGGHAGDGGAIRADGTLRLRNVLVDSNVAATNGGGLYVGMTGAAIVDQVTFVHNVGGKGAGAFAGGKAKMTNVTFSGNNSSQGGGGLFVDGSGSATLLHATFSGNTGPLATALATQGGFGMTGSVIEGSCLYGNDYFPGRDIVEDPSCKGFLVDDAGLEPLTQAGNAVPTLPLKPTSPAVDFAFANTCPKVDARGVKRPQGAGCDAGAYELVP
jgi:CSLREA domain-containing protein